MPNPVVNDFFKKPEKGFEWLERFAKGRFTFAGWENWQREMKRLDIALKAFSIVHSVNRQTCLVLAGSVPDWAQNSVEEMQLLDSVLFPGKLIHEDIVNLAYFIDCCIISSDHETFGNPAIESLAAGKPVVTTKCGGPESVVTEPYLGRVVDKGDATMLAMAMQETMENINTYDSKKISAECSRLYSEKAFSERWVAVYKKLNLITDRN